MWAASGGYLLLQAHYAGPLLLEQALILFACRIVKRLWDVGLFPKGGGGVGGIDDAEVGDYGFVSVGGRQSGERRGEERREEGQQGALTALRPVCQSESRSWRRQPAATIHWRHREPGAGGGGDARSLLRPWQAAAGCGRGRGRVGGCGQKVHGGEWCKRGCSRAQGRAGRDCLVAIAAGDVVWAPSGRGAWLSWSRE